MSVQRLVATKLTTWSCSTFRAASTRERKDIVSKSRCCFNCLRIGHTVANCTSESKCKQCQKKHHSFLHDDVKNSNGMQITTIVSRAKDKEQISVPHYNVNLLTQDNNFQNCFYVDNFVGSGDSPDVPNAILTSFNSECSLEKFVVNLSQVANDEDMVGSGGPDTFLHRNRCPIICAQNRPGTASTTDTKKDLVKFGPAKLGKDEDGSGGTDTFLNQYRCPIILEKNSLGNASTSDTRVGLVNFGPPKCGEDVDRWG